MAGFALGVRFVYYFVTEGGAGKIQSLILAAVLLMMGFQTILLGFIADLLSVNRRLLEELQAGHRSRKAERAELRALEPQRDLPKDLAPLVEQPVVRHRAHPD
jgi:hypothetical protein